MRGFVQTLRSRSLCWLLAMGAAACGQAAAKGPKLAAESPQVAPLRVERGAIVDRLVLTGQLEAVTSVDLSVPRLPSSATLSIAWLAADGATVKQGDRVVELDASSFIGTIEDKRTAVTNAENELASQQAKASLDISTKAFEVEKAQAELRKAELLAGLPAELSPPRDYQQRQLDLARARDSLIAARDALAAQQRTSQLEQAVQQITLSRAQQDLADLMRRLDQLAITAPRDGLVQITLNEWENRKYVVGDKTYSGAQIAAMPDLSDLQVRARLSDVDDGAVAEGMAADCILDAYPSRVWPGRIRKVSPAARSAGKDSPRRFFDVLVGVGSGAPALLRPGMSVRVEVIRRRLDSALLVPRTALRTWPGKSALRLQSGETQTIDVDFCTELSCVVRSGVLEGTRVLPALATEKGGR